MNPTSFQHIQPLIVDVQENGRSLQVTFQCPLSGTKVSSRASASRDNSLSGQVKKSTQRSLLYAVQRAIGEVIRDVFGYSNPIGRVASDVTRRTMYSASSQMMNGLSQSEREQTIVKAFESVQRKFTWDPNQNRWIGAAAGSQALSPFDRQKQQHPIVHPYDAQVLSRMLVQVSMADGHLAQAEREWLSLVLNPEHGTIDDALRHPNLSAAELGNTSQGGVRTTLLMFAWAVALCDEDLDHTEEQLLNSMASGLRLSTSEAQEAKLLAQTYILDNAIQYIYGSSQNAGSFARQQVLSLATKIGLSESQALDIEAKAKRRMSNF